MIIRNRLLFWTVIPYFMKTILHPWGAFFSDYSGIGILGIDGISVLLGAIPFSELTEYHSVHSAPDSRMNRMEGMPLTQNRQNTRSFGQFLAGNPTRPPASVAAGFRLKKLEWK